MSKSVPAKLEHHPLSEVLPLMKLEEYEATKADVISRKERGLPPFIEKGLLFEGKILDARHRYRISRETGIPLEFEIFKGTYDEARDYVYSKAMHRSMDASQKAASAYLMIETFKGEARERQLSGL